MLLYSHTIDTGHLQTIASRPKALHIPGKYLLAINLRLNVRIACDGLQQKF